VKTDVLRIAMLSIHSNPMGDLGTIDTGGMSVYIRELARELGRRGHRIDIYSRLQNGRYQAVVPLYENVRLIHLDIGNNGRLSKMALYPYLSDFQRSLEQFRRAERLNYDLIHSHYWLSGGLGEALQDLWSRPHVVMFHTLAEAKNRTLSGLQEPAVRIAAEKKLVKTCHRIIAPTQREKGSLIRYYGAAADKIGIVPCGVNLTLFKPQDKTAARKQLGYAPETSILLYVGRFEPVKGADTLIEALAHLADHRRLQLVMVGGDGERAPETQYLKDKTRKLGIEDRVVFAGRVDQNCLPPYYGSADMLVIPSRYESFSLVGLEALACGRPVVSTPVGAMDRLIIEGQTGKIAADASPGALAREIESMLTDFLPPGADVIRDSVLAYSWSNVASAVLNEYETAFKAASIAEEGRLSLEASCG
jgi:D-inositol-3-phosphate glycosyltransferase